MTQEQKDLLLKDLCARLPYGVVVKDRNGVHKLTPTNTEFIDLFNGKCNIAPYLFPLSSMTEEQYEKFKIISGWDGDIEDIRRGKFSCIGYIGLDYIYDTIDWYNKNHFDYRGLIPMGSAIDATNLNIY
jgi:hypothetical protein